MSVLLVALTQSCDALPEELFEKNVSLIKNGWCDLDVEIGAETDLLDLPISVGVSGTSRNDKDIAVELAIDAEALATYNYDKYRNDTVLYYTLFPQDALVIPDDVVIASGKESTVATFKIDMSRLEDKYADYVLPLTIRTTSDYMPSEEYATALYHIIFKNHFSGTYTGSMELIRVNTNGANNDTDKLSVSNKTLYAISADECFFYAGNYNRDTKGREKFIMTLKMADKLPEISPAAKEVVFDTPNPELELKYWYNKFDSISVIDYSTARNATDNRLLELTTIFDVSYTFMNTNSLRYRLKGRMSRVESIMKDDLDAYY